MSIGLPFLVVNLAPKVAVASIVPTDLTGLVTWWKADAGTAQNSDGSTPAAADGDPVGYWADQSGNNRHATNGGTNYRPLLKTGANGINSLPVLRADGNDDWLQTASIAHGIGTGDFWWLTVLRRHTSNVASFGGICGNGGGAPAWYIRHSLYDRLWSWWDGGAGSGGFDSTLTVGTAYILEFGRTSGVTYCRVNGVQEATTHAETGNMPNAVLKLFDSGWSERAKADIGEFIFYSNKPSDANLTLLRSYLNGRWAVY